MITWPETCYILGNDKFSFSNYQYFLIFFIYFFSFTEVIQYSVIVTKNSDIYFSWINILLINRSLSFLTLRFHKNVQCWLMPKHISRCLETVVFPLVTESNYFKPNFTRGNWTTSSHHLQKHLQGCMLWFCAKHIILCVWVDK